MVKPELIDTDPNIRKLMEEAAGLVPDVVPVRKPPRKLTECKVRIWLGNTKPQVHWGIGERCACTWVNSGHTSLFNYIKQEVQADLLETHISDLKMYSYRPEESTDFQVLIVRWNGLVKRVHVLAYDRWYGSLVQPVDSWDKPLRSQQQHSKGGSKYWDYNIKNMFEVDQ